MSRAWIRPLVFGLWSLKSISGFCWLTQDWFWDRERPACVSCTEFAEQGENVLMPTKLKR